MCVRVRVYLSSEDNSTFSDVQYSQKVQFIKTGIKGHPERNLREGVR